MVSTNINNDAELFCILHKKYGKQFINEFDGSFAIIIYAKKIKELFIYRDHAGLKPIYYSKKNELLFFSSDINTILMSGIISKEMDRGTVIDFLLFNHPKDGKTFYNNIYKVPRASVSQINPVKIYTYKYFDFLDEKKNKITKKINYKERYLSLFKTAISNSIINNDKVGVTISGGLDSSAIACCLNDLKKDGKVESRSVIFSALDDINFKKVDEREYMDLCVKKCASFNHEYIDIKNYACLDSIDSLTDICSGPVSAINSYMFEKIFSSLKESDTNIMIDGIDGDSVISHGYELFWEYAFSLRFFSLMRLEKEYRSVLQIKTKPTFFMLIKKYFLLNIIPNKLLWKKLNKGNKSLYPFNAYKTLNSNIKKNKTCYEYVIEHFKRFPMKQNGNSRLTHARSMSGPHWEYAIESLEPISNKYNIDHRMPFFNKKLMEFCLNVPSELKFKKGINRYTFRESLRGIVPDTILNRVTKSDLSPNNNIQIESLKIEYIIKEIASEDSPIFNLIDKDEVIKMFKGLKESKNKDQLIHIIYQLLALSKWMRKENFVW